MYLLFGALKPPAAKWLHAHPAAGCWSLLLPELGSILIDGKEIGVLIRPRAISTGLLSLALRVDLLFNYSLRKEDVK